jgi:hypothetical protein
MNVLALGAPLFVAIVAIAFAHALQKYCPGFPMRLLAVLLAGLAAGAAYLAWLGFIVDRGVAISSAVCSPVLFAFAVRAWRSRRWRTPTRLFELDGVAGSVLAVAVVVFAVRGGAFGIVATCIAGAAIVALVIRHMSSWHRVIARIERRLVDAKPWQVLPLPTSDDGADDSTMGMWNGVRVWVKPVTNALSIRTVLLRWPHDVTIAPGSGTTGDRQLDELVAITGDEAAWRPLLDAVARAQLVALRRDADCTLSNQTLELVVRDPARAEAVLDRCTAFASELRDSASDPMARVFEQTRRDPCAGVRVENFRWLVAQRWNVQTVYRAAMFDPDPRIAAWAVAEAPSDGAFR